MKTTYMSKGEIMMASYNLREIERALGHSVPPACLDASKYCKRPLTLGESFQIASNIRRMEESMNRNRNTPLFKHSHKKEYSDRKALAFPFVILFYAAAYIYVEYIEPLFR